MYLILILICIVAVMMQLLQDGVQGSRGEKISRHLVVGTTCRAKETTEFLFAIRRSGHLSEPGLLISCVSSSLVMPCIPGVATGSGCSACSLQQH